MSPSQAHSDFLQLIAMPSALLGMEALFPAPIQGNDILSSNALKGGSAVLMVAAFESYLQMSFEEYVYILDAYSPSVNLSILSDNVWPSGVFTALEVAMKGTRNRPLHGPRNDRIPEIMRICELFCNQRLVPSAFSDTQGNPNSECIKEMFKRVGVENVMMVLKQEYESYKSTSVSDNYITDKLKEIIDRRNAVAHNANVAGVSAADLSEAILFLKDLTTCIDRIMDSQFASLLRQCLTHVSP